MNRLMKHVLCLTALSLTIPVFAQNSTWQIDPAHSAALFSVRHLGVSTVHGTFSKVTGTVVIDDKDPSKSSVRASIDTTTLTTENDQRDTHLKSPDFFDVSKYPTMTFESKQVTNSNGKIQVLGTLTMHGVSKDVTLDLDTPSKEVSAMGKQHRGFTGTTTINRRDFGLVWGGALPTGEAMVSDEAKVTLEVELSK